MSIIEKNKTIKMKDIAQSVGVSTVTVSKALNNKDGVSEELRKIIKDKAKDMGYIYNPIPKQMLNGKTNNIAILVSKKFLVRGYDVYFQIYETIIDRLSKLGYYGILEVLSKQAEFDGLILLGQISEPYLAMITSQKTPFVLLDFYGSYENMDTVVADNFFGSYMITSYLIKNGHKEIGFAGNYKATSSTIDRYMGYLKALIENDLIVNIPNYTVGDEDLGDGNIELTLPLELPTAFVCNNDKIANALIIKLNEHGYHVPDDISIVGFDNFEQANNYLPGITTVEVDFRTMAIVSVELIIEKINNLTVKPGRKLISCHLVIKDSVKNLK